MSLETRLRNTGSQPGGGGGGSSNSAGLAGTGIYYVLASNDTTLPNSYVLQAGANTQFAFAGSNFTISSNTGGASNSAGLLGTGGYFILGSANAQMPNSSVIQAGSSVSFNYTGSNLFISAITNAGGSANSAGLAGTGVFYLGTSANSTWPNWLVISPGSSVTSFISGSNYVINATTSTFLGSGGLASTGGLYIVTSASPLFPNSRILTAGSSVSVVTDATAIYVTAITANASAFAITSRLINTTSPLGGGGDLSADRTLTAGSLSTIGSANQFIRVNTDGATWGYINFVGGSSITLTQTSGKLQIDASTGGGAGSGTVNTGSATYLAYYPALGTTVDDATLTVTTGSGIAPFNVPILTVDPSSITSGDIWILNSAGVFLRIAINATNYTVQLTTPDP